jgi:hypothetical protein
LVWNRAKTLIKSLRLGRAALTAFRAYYSGAIIDVLSEHSAVCFAFYNWQANRDQGARTFFRAFLKQAVRRSARAAIPSQINSLYNGGEKFASCVSTLEDIVDLLKTVVQNEPVVYICVDALDECSDVERHALLETLAQLPPKFRIMVTSRRSVDAGRYFADLQIIEIAAKHDDIQHYLRYRMDKDKKQFPERMNDELESLVVSKLTEKAAGL